LNSSATQLLQRLGLPQTETLSLQHAASLDPAARVYLRYGTNSGYKNSRVAVGEIRADLATFMARMESGHLITCERCYDTIVGGITVVKRDFAYSEMVQGHSNALLRRGCCGARLLQYRDGRVCAATTVQKWRAEQGDEYTYRPMGNMDRRLSEQLRGQVDSLAKVPEENVLLEWMWTSAGFFYCDASRLGDDTFGDLLPTLWVTGTRRVSLRTCEPNTLGRGRTHWDVLDCDHSGPAEDGDTIVCVNGAVLSHFVTRALVKRVTILWANPEELP
jgi:hypothetical protein